MWTNSNSDTIVAISTPAGAAQVAIVRLSGSQAFPIIDELFQGPAQPSQMPPYSRLCGYLSLPTWQVQVPVTLYLMKAPRSYTREDVVECHTIGAPPLLEMLLDQIMACGARPAEPGEFTRRAFLAGRIDLSQVEGVLAMIKASDERERQCAMYGLCGGLARLISQQCEQLREIAAWLEALIDFAEDDVSVDPQELVSRLANSVAALQTLAGEEEGASASSAPVVVLTGRPNAGKSSLFNYIVGQEQALVTPVAGTTRDWLQASCSYQGLDFVLLDTPGLMRQANSALWQQALDNTRAVLARSHLILFLIDSSVPLAGEEQALLATLPARPVLVVLSKADQPAVLQEAHIKALSGHEVVWCSTKDGGGIGPLLERIHAHLSQAWRVDRTALVNARQRHAVCRAIAALQRARQALQEHLSPEFAALELREALDQLGTIVGDVVTDDLLEVIFAQFCIGK